MGEFKVHRVKFFNYMPSGIRCMAYNSSTDKLALARLDGSIEIFNISNNYFQEKVIPGNDSRSIEAICWVGHDRLFTASLSGEVMEVDLQKLCPKYKLHAFGGPIWSMSCNAEESHLAVGCEDGSVKVFEILPEKIQFERNLDRQKGRILSISWHKSGALIAAGTIDMIRIFDVKSGHAVQRILVDRGAAACRNWECVVWSIAYLSDNTVVSADSTGKVQFWDTEKGTLIKSYLISKCDVLSLSVSEEEDSILAGTSEGTVVQFQWLPTTIENGDYQWVRTRTFKHHTHDVRAVVETRTALISGGLDTHLVFRPLLDKVEEKSYDTALRKVTFPHRKLVCCAKKHNLLMFQYPDQLEVWKLGGTDVKSIQEDKLPVTRKPEKLLQLKRKGSDHICCSAISQCGNWIAYSTVSSIRLYQLQYDSNRVNIKKVQNLPKVLYSAHQLQFSADSSKLFIASAQAAVHVLSIFETECKHLHTFHPKSDVSEPVHLLSASANGRWLAAASQNCEINIYDLKKLKHHCGVPVYSANPSAMEIHPETDNLLIVYSDRQIFEFSITEKQYTDWSRKVQKEGLHSHWFERDTPVTHVAFNPRKPSQIMLHDMYMLCIIDKSLPLPDRKMPLYNQLILKNLTDDERKRQSHAFKICKNYQHLLYADLLDEEWMVVIERPIIEIISQLPAPVRQKKFGT
ncbi:U3 small nucleolar RNA-associated protein 4 homolog [Polypterus senegalus]|uniref:U3 small nucleolar RNA-associated protein 4 homolog n=1 Tax=Polypterus senegalus TaxID=55291 RepID=UPI00196526D3|nr:U3 small nucleolar RNA-associated protein 4 homolog [Polypterus senegalus]